MGQILFFYGSIAILVIFLVKEYETVPCQVDCQKVKCPANCTCTEGDVNCHGRDLTYIPCIPSGIKHLNLSNSNISILSNNEIKNLACSFETLKHMILRDCKIKLFVGDVFINLTHLEVLDLSFNEIVSNQKESIQRALGSLNRAPLQKLKLDRLLIQNGVQEIFKYFDGRHLTHLSMRANQIQEFEDKVLENFTKLIHLNLHGNWITKISLSSGVETLKLFNLSHNQINIFPPIFCDHKTGKTHYKNLKNLDLSWNQIIVPYSQNWNCLKTLETLNLSRNDMEDIGNNDSFSNLTSLKTLILSEMRFSLTRIRKEALKSDSLQHLDLSGNGLNFENRKEVDETVFHYLPNLTSLDVSDNDLGSDGVKKLTNLSRLETLIMKHVNLRLLPDDFLGHFPNLKYLNLYRNKIEQFSANAFQNVRLIEVLNISDNLISTFPVPPLPSTTLKSLKKFDFAYNYFLCDCEILKLRKWINKVLSDPNKTNLISRYPDQYWCYKPQPLYQVLLNVAEPTHCKNIKYQLILSIVCSASICVVFTVFLIVAYVYRWEIKLFLHKMRHNKRDGYHPLTYTFEYNTYVVYAEKDSAWVIHDLLKDLEEAKYKAYTRDRDSVPGVARCDEIVDNIYKSKTVIFVLSKNFMACQWCLYQLNVAQARAVKLGPHFMIPVLLECIDTKYMKKSVQHLFRTSKPIEWARQSTKNKLFWSELKTALDEDLNDEFEETGYQSFDADYASIGT
ncbi:hypothetical protein CHS0354_009760 [Potamilus streckersoni]|uniref:TIR domain-containing protein n=1 Tax=Potamilus streckersoni TaxID=2493646 RepID=A0AAE0SW13_9BIVA|nr:hypothetical protein CHS0354_009760 [Potamilus streckersoni]